MPVSPAFATGRLGLSLTGCLDFLCFCMGSFGMTSAKLQDRYQAKQHESLANPDVS